MQAELLYDANCQLAEGPVWHDEALWFTDIDGRKLHRLRDGTLETWEMPVRVGLLVPTDAGRWILGCDDGLFFWMPGGEREPIANPQTGSPGETRFNDGKTSPEGRLFAGTMVLDGPRGSAALYRLDPGGSITELFGGVGTSNGLDWSADAGTFWYADTPTGQVDAFDHDSATGKLSNRRTILKNFPGHPDGLCADDADTLWVGQWGGSCVDHCDPHTGQHLGRIELPVPNVTSCCFGGKDLRQLFITTARTENIPGSGGIWTVKAMPGAGRPVNLFREG